MPVPLAGRMNLARFARLWRRSSATRRISAIPASSNRTACSQSSFGASSRCSTRASTMQDLVGAPERGRRLVRAREDRHLGRSGEVLDLREHHQLLLFGDVLARARHDAGDDDEVVVDLLQRGEVCHRRHDVAQAARPSAAADARKGRCPGAPSPSRAARVAAPPVTCRRASRRARCRGRGRRRGRPDRSRGRAAPAAPSPAPRRGGRAATGATHRTRRSRRT